MEQINTQINNNMFYDEKTGFYWITYEQSDANIKKRIDKVKKN